MLFPVNRKYIYESKLETGLHRFSLYVLTFYFKRVTIAKRTYTVGLWLQGSYIIQLFLIQSERAKYFHQSVNQVGTSVVSQLFWPVNRHVTLSYFDQKERVSSVSYFDHLDWRALVFQIFWPIRISLVSQFFKQSEGGWYLNYLDQSISVKFIKNRCHYFFVVFLFFRSEICQVNNYKRRALYLLIVKSRTL